MRRWTAVNYGQKCVREQAMTPNAGMCLCVMPLKKQDTFQGNVLYSRKQSEPCEVWTMKVLRLQTVICLIRKPEKKTSYVEKAL